LSKLLCGKQKFPRDEFPYLVKEISWEKAGFFPLVIVKCKRREIN
jgi:hypothetical protein